MQILVERIEKHQNLFEEVDGVRKYYIQGPCIQTNVQNKNGRIYEKEVVGPEIERFIREDLANNEAVGELNHPLEDPRVNFERVSHKFVSLLEEGDNWIGKAVVTRNTAMGAIVAGLMDENVRMGISTRAVGSTKKRDGIAYVQKDFHLISPGDIVSDPSAPDAYLTNLMENKEWVWANGVLVEREAEIKDLVNTAAKKKQLNEEGLRKLFNYILTKI